MKKTPNRKIFHTQSTDLTEINISCHRHGGLFLIIFSKNEFEIIFVFISLTLWLYEKTYLYVSPKTAKL
jgi:hypothetical protein